MVYYTGDTHGNFTRIQHAIHEDLLKPGDTIVILGDAGLNYYGNHYGDSRRKRDLHKILGYHGLRLLCIHGNHEMRPESISTYQTKTCYNGIVYFEPQFETLMFAKDGEIYDLDGKRSVAIGGAYSVDKFYRLQNDMLWFPDEQISPKDRDRITEILEHNDWKIDQVLSHTCPAKYTPIEAFLPDLDQSTIDKTMENWLDKIEDKLQYSRWLCGHWHIDKSIDKIRFMMHDIIT